MAAPRGSSDNNKARLWGPSNWEAADFFVTDGFVVYWRWPLDIGAFIAPILCW